MTSIPKLFLIYLKRPKIVLDRLQRSRNFVNKKKNVEGIRILLEMIQIQEFRGRQK